MKDGGAGAWSGYTKSGQKPQAFRLKTPPYVINASKSFESQAKLSQAVPSRQRKPPVASPGNHQHLPGIFHSFSERGRRQGIPRLQDPLGKETRAPPISRRLTPQRVGPFNPSIPQSIDRPINQSTNQSTNQQINHSFIQSIIHQSIDQSSIQSSID